MNFYGEKIWKTLFPKAYSKVKRIYAKELHIALGNEAWGGVCDESGGDGLE